jgi:hypothetical protein
MPVSPRLMVKLDGDIAYLARQAQCSIFVLRSLSAGGCA